MLSSVEHKKKTLKCAMKKSINIYKNGNQTHFCLGIRNSTGQKSIEQHYTDSTTKKCHPRIIYTAKLFFDFEEKISSTVQKNSKNTPLADLPYQ